MNSPQEGSLVSAAELVDAVADASGNEIVIRRNGAEPVRGMLVRADLGSAEVDGQRYAVVHLVIRRATRDGSTPAMISLLAGAQPDEDFFWPACPVEIDAPSGRRRLLLR